MSLWRRHLGSDPRAVGRVVQLDGQPLTLVGVVPDEVVTFLRERKELFDEAEFEGRLILPLVPAAAGRSRVLLERRRENPVVIVGEAFCREHLGSADPLQAGIRLGVPLFGITGVVKDVRQSGPTRAAWNTVYLLQTRKSRLQTTHVVVKAAGPISDVVRGVVAELSARDIRVCVDEGQRLAALLEGTLAPRTRTLRLLLMSAAVVMLLTAFSVNGALGQFVESQTRQIAVRTALGANRRHTFSLFAGHLGVPCGIGLVLGCFGGWSLARTLSSQLFGVTAADPAAAAGAVAAVLACALIAAGGPFWRARRLDLVSLLQG